MTPLLRAVVEEAARGPAPAESLLAAENAWRAHHGPDGVWRIHGLIYQELPRWAEVPEPSWSLRELWAAVRQALEDRRFRARMAIVFDRDRLLGEWQD